MGQDDLSFGGENVYYAGDPDQYLKRSLSDQEIEIQNVLRKTDQNILSNIEWAFKQSNSLIREALRNETALRLSWGEEHKNVQVKIVDGIPQLLRERIDIEPGKLYFLINKVKLHSGRDGLDFLIKHLSMAQDLLPEGPDVSSDNIKMVKKFIDDLLHKIKISIRKGDIIEILKIERDILGAYFYTKGEIHLYWVAIGLFAKLLEVSVEALTIVVAAHELAHAYTHLGADIDGGRWPPSAFAAASLNVVEGLAQFYCGLVCERLESRFLGVTEAYLKLLEKQAGSYTIHLNWVPPNSTRSEEDKQEIRDKWDLLLSKNVSEAVRSALLETRIHGLTSYGQFNSSLKEFQERLTPKKS
jgi:hypothetical protein